MSNKPTDGKKDEKPEAEVEEAEVVAEETPPAGEDAAEQGKKRGRKGNREPSEGKPEEKSEIDERVAAAEEAVEELAEDVAEITEEPEVEEEPEPEEEHEAEPEHHEHAEDYHDENERPRTMASLALSGLIIFLIGAAIALWAAPRVAPYMPAGIAKMLETGSTVSDADLTQLRTAFDGRMRALEAKTLSVATVNDLVDAQLAETRTTLDARIGELADKIAAADSAAIESRLADVETTLAGLESRFTVLSDSLTDISAGGAGLTPEDAARIAGFTATVEGLRGEISSLSQKSGALSQRIDDVAAAAARRVEEAETAAEAVKAEAETAIRGMALTTALEELEVSVRSGAPFANALAALSEAAQSEPPEALHAAAAAGAPSIATLRASFPDAAHLAIAAAVEADAEKGFVGQAAGWFKAQFTGLPVEETAGDDAPAILSRVAARLGEGNLDAALAEADTLPEAAAAEMAPWKAAAEKRRDALSAFAAWRAALEANG
jgi:hypothetical protein